MRATFFLPARDTQRDALKDVSSVHLNFERNGGGRGFGGKRRVYLRKVLELSDGLFARFGEGLVSAMAGF